MTKRPDTISGPITYNPDLFDAATITRLVQHWQTLLAGALAAPDRSIVELPLLTDSERQQILVDWNSTRVEYPKDQCVHELFDAQVERVPDATALKFKDEEMTYGDLGAKQPARPLSAKFRCRAGYPGGPPLGGARPKWLWA